MKMMEAIADNLGVEMGKPFIVENGSQLVTGMYKFTPEELMRCDTEAPAPGVLGKLVAGKYKVSKDPVIVTPPQQEEVPAAWKPEPGEKYWFILLPWGVPDKSTFSKPNDWYNYKMGNCYRTREEARKHKDEWKEDFESFLESTTEYGGLVNGKGN